ncbi:hypothetical protein [Dethiosulfovibrio salsuginis]|uniref:Flagellar hook-length control protein FliK n=1 Tax=Dethiosulfovibrio salsuginis TaxID=561720 RepID=A0A1X7KB76_9BACT|nr:hypothetical protein [Dethiosulfovibrio salsuginis]SMG38087.1 hypothetical protein SAMN06275492_12429 [Dethiosulfovibrio salsuginis]
MVDGIGSPQNLNIGVGRGQGTALSPAQQGAARGKGIPDGALVEGRVLSFKDGAYMVRIAGQNMLARSNLSLFPGQHFQAIWDAQGDVPTLRLRPEDAALLGRLPKADQEAAALLLSKGLPVTDGFLLHLRKELRRLGDPRAMDSLIELMARGEKVSSEKVGILSWYMSLDGQSVGKMWKRIQKELQERRERGENPLSSLKEMKEGDDEIARFLKGHGLLSRPPREEFSNASLAGAWWPGPDQESIPAKVSFSSRRKKGDKRSFFRVDFLVEGRTLGDVSGGLESDGKSLTVSLKAQTDDAAKALSRALRELQEDLEKGPLSLQYLGVALKAAHPNRYLRLDVEA